MNDRNGKPLQGRALELALSGKSGNPGGRFKRVKELQRLALDETEESFKVIIEIRNNVAEDPRTRLAASKLLIAYGIGEPPKEIRIESDRGDGDPMDALSVEELRELARQSLIDIEPKALGAGDGSDDDDGDEAEH